MAPYYFFFTSIVVSIIFILTRLYIVQKEKSTMELFIVALKDENQGHFQEALITYESALSEMKKVRFHTTLKKKIVEKVCLLHTLIEYKKSFAFVRQ